MCSPASQFSAMCRAETKELPIRGIDRGRGTGLCYIPLLNSTKLNGVDSERYLHHANTHTSDHHISRLNELLPWNLSAPHKLTSS